MHAPAVWNWVSQRKTTEDQTLSYREHLSCCAVKLKSRNNLIAKLAGTSWGANASTLGTSALALCYSAAEHCCPVQCTWFQAVCNPCSSHGCQCSAMLHLLLYVVMRQLTICFKSSKPIQIGLCMLISLSIHIHGLHLDAQYCQTWHLSTQLRSGGRTGRRLGMIQRRRRRRCCTMRTSSSAWHVQCIDTGQSMWRNTIDSVLVQFWLDNSNSTNVC